MTRPAENQQTVEAALDVLRHAVVMNVAVEGRTDKTKTEAEALTVLGAALRDLVAQAELAAEMAGELRAYLNMAEPDCGEDDCVECWPDRQVRTLLARLDGIAGKDHCKHTNEHFDRSLCACGSMHYYCDDCGEQTNPCPDGIDNKDAADA